tara:strand:+ start:932 stop:1384 length:453 start_codon:yes stop_codon:yes gene_type:complete
MEKKKLNKWEQRFVDDAKYIAEWSKDKGTKVGCVITNDENDVLSRGYNGFPRGADDDTDQRRYEKPSKYMWTEHSERNAIYNAARNGISLKGSNAFVTYFPCIDCTRGLIQVGVKKIYAPKPDFNHKKWGESWVESIIMLKECGVEIIWT